MEAVATLSTLPITRLLEYPAQPIRVYVKANEHRPSKIKPMQKSGYPKIVMPEQPTGYIRPRENDCL